VSTATITGDEDLDFSLSSLHYDSGDDIPFTIDLTDLSTNAATTYDLEWMVCRDVDDWNDDYSDWVDRDCEVAFVYTSTTSGWEYAVIPDYGWCDFTR
jgi:hypothetical protein